MLRLSHVSQEHREAAEKSNQTPDLQIPPAFECSPKPSSKLQVPEGHCHMQERHAYEENFLDANSRPNPWSIPTAF